ncbi:MAG: ABC transporter substrate-binding protein [Desulfotomaculaceae bacterium]|nr:ABC transporter substrate-binding protein [Desulfotomaculaceae bacterium]
MQTKMKLLIAITILALSIIFITHSRNNTIEEKETQTVRVMESVRSPYFLPLYLAQNLKFFEEQNLIVKITTSSPGAIRAALNSQRTDIALCGIQKIIFNPDQSAKEGNSPKIFATMSLRDGSLLLGKLDNSEFQWPNLKDKSIIGNSQDDSSGIALESVLRENDLPPYRRVTIYHNIPEALRISAFRSGTGNYIQLLEPEASYAEIKSYGKVVASVGVASGTMVVTAFAAMPCYIEEQPENIQRFTNAIYKAQLWLNQHSAEEAVQVAYPSFNNLDRQVLLNSIKRYQSLKIWAENPLVSREAYENFNTAAKEAGEIASFVPYETAVITDFARQAAETIVYNQEIEKPKRNSLLRRLLNN